MQLYYLSHQVRIPFYNLLLKKYLTLETFQRPLAGALLDETQDKTEFMLRKALAKQHVLNRPTNQHLDE